LFIEFVEGKTFVQDVPLITLVCYNSNLLWFTPRLKKKKQVIQQKK